MRGLKLNLLLAKKKMITSHHQNLISWQNAGDPGDNAASYNNFFGSIINNNKLNVCHIRACNGSYLTVF